MSFHILIQQSIEEPIKVTKSPTTLYDLEGYLRDGSDIINPSVMIECDISTLSGANYMTISEFGRSYFISSIRSVRTRLVEVSGHVDVLSSFSDEIKSNNGIVFRQENDWNLYLNDGVLEIYQNPIVTTHKFPKGFSGQSYVLALAGRRGVVSTAAAGGGGTVIPGPGITLGAGGGETSGAGTYKTSKGLAEYALGHLNCPYWWGTFGNIANQSLFDYKMYQYPEWYQSKIAAGRDFTQDFNQQVFDCVGLIKGYRWSDTMNGVPTYGGAGQDVSAAGLFGQCSIVRGAIGDHYWTTLYSAYPGIVLWAYQDLGHVGVSMGDGTVVHATTGTYNKVIRSNIASDSAWLYWGMPDWMYDNIGTPLD